jgi:hypothetical protein
MDVVMKHGSRGERPKEKTFQERRVVRVLPASDLIRKHLKHQPSGIGWLKEGSVEWPLDAFTRNRLRDGDVTIEPPKPKQLESDKPDNKSKKPASEQKPAPKPETTSSS